MILRNKKILLYSLLLCIILTITFLTFNNSKNKSTAKIIVKENVIDLQQVSKDEKVKVTFEIKNVGDEDLMISNVVPSCHCTVPKWKKKPVSKGDSFIIEVEYNDLNPGYFQEDILIYCNIDNSPILLTIEGQRLPS